MLDHNKDRLGGSGRSTATGVTRHLKYEVTDLWRWNNPEEVFSCYSDLYRTVSCIDLAFATAYLLHRVTNVDFFPRGISDHAPLRVELKSKFPGSRGT